MSFKSRRFCFSVKKTIISEKMMVDHKESETQENVDVDIDFDSEFGELDINGDGDVNLDFLDDESLDSVSSSDDVNESTAESGGITSSAGSEVDDEFDFNDEDSQPTGNLDDEFDFNDEGSQLTGDIDDELGFSDEKGERLVRDSGSDGLPSSGLLEEFSDSVVKNSSSKEGREESRLSSSGERSDAQKAKSNIFALVLLASVVSGALASGVTYFLNSKSSVNEIEAVLSRIDAIEGKSSRTVTNIDEKIEALDSLVNDRIDKLLLSSASLEELSSVKESLSNEYKILLSKQEETSDRINNLAIQAEGIINSTKNNKGLEDYNKLITALVSLKSMVDSNQLVSDKQYSELLDLVRLQELNVNHELEKIKGGFQVEIADVLKAVKSNQERFKSLKEREKSGNATESNYKPKSNMVESALGLDNEINIMKSPKPTYIQKGFMENKVFLKVPVDGGGSFKLLNFKVGDLLDGYGKITAIDNINESVTTENGKVKLVNEG